MTKRIPHCYARGLRKQDKTHTYDGASYSHPWVWQAPVWEACGVLDGSLGEQLPLHGRAWPRFDWLLRRICNHVTPINRCLGRKQAAQEETGGVHPHRCLSLSLPSLYGARGSVSLTLPTNLQGCCTITGWTCRTFGQIAAQ